MAADTLDRLLAALAVRLHSFSVCEIQQGWRLAFSSFEAITVHYVLQGSGVLRVSNGPWLPFAPQSILVIPARQSHVVGDAGPAARMVHAEDRCSLLADGLVTFTAGDGSRDTLLLCGAISASHGGALGLFDLLREPMIEGFSESGIVQPVFELMLAEVANPGLGTQAMTEALMKQCLIALLRRHLRRDDTGAPVFLALRHPRLARAVLAVIENPAALHTVESLASLAGMSRASFAGHFSQAFQQGPIDFVQKVRLRIAARLLATTDLPLKVVAQSVGYAGPTSLSRAFQTAYGADPTTYRRLGRHDEREPRLIDGLAASQPDNQPATAPEGMQAPPGRA